jgi:hypothetical protein
MALLIICVLAVAMAIYLEHQNIKYNGDQTPQKAKNKPFEPKGKPTPKHDTWFDKNDRKQRG